MTGLENYNGNPERAKERMTYGKDAIQWRRARVLELNSQGYTHREIVSKLQIAKVLYLTIWLSLKSSL